MKKCPTCQSVYTDTSLKFCLNDGATLIIPQTEEATQSFNQPIHTNQPIQIPIANQTVETQFRQTVQPIEQKSGGKGLIFALVGGLAFLLILGVAGVVGWFLMNSKKDDSVAVVNNKNASPTATATPVTTNLATPTPDETASLKQKIADLEKKMQQQKQTGKDNVPIITDNSSTAPPKPSVVTAKAHSPGDGFLALRTGPSAETGDRILEIPHGSTIKVLSCLKPAAGKKGRWCKVDYNGNLGWAFDGFMIYQK